MAGDEDFLSRWSRRKREARASVPGEPLPAAAAASEAAATAAPAPVEPAPLPALDTLTPEADFAPFMAPEVDGDVRRQALKTLFSDPRFNTMDMMDVYVDDYSKADPIPASWLDKLEQLSRLGDRAGRDREEAERKAQAEAEATATGAAGPPDSGPEAPPAAGPADAPIPAQESRLADPSGIPIPPAPVRESGT